MRFAGCSDLAMAMRMIVPVPVPVPVAVSVAVVRAMAVSMLIIRQAIDGSVPMPLRLTVAAAGQAGTLLLAGSGAFVLAQPAALHQPFDMVVMAVLR